MVTWNSTSLLKQVMADRRMITKELGLLRDPLPRQSWEGGSIEAKKRITPNPFWSSRDRVGGLVRNLSSRTLEE
jgi:hypothetical protein